MVCRILVSPPGTEPGRLHWKCGVLTTGPPGSSPSWLFKEIELAVLSHLNFCIVFLSWVLLLPTSSHSIFYAAVRAIFQNHSLDHVTPLFGTLQRSPWAATVKSKLLHLSYNVFTDLYLNFQFSAMLPHTKQTKKPPPSPLPTPAPPSTRLTVYRNAMHSPHSTWKITFISQSSAQVLPLPWHFSDSLNPHQGKLTISSSILVPTMLHCT